MSEVVERLVDARDGTVLLVVVCLGAVWGGCRHCCLFGLVLTTSGESAGLDNGWEGDWKGWQAACRGRGGCLCRSGARLTGHESRLRPPIAMSHLIMSSLFAVGEEAW